MLPLSTYDQLCATDDSCKYTISDERLADSGSNYQVRVVAGNVVGTGEPLTCDGQIGKWAFNTCIASQRERERERERESESQIYGWYWSPVHMKSLSHAMDKLISVFEREPGRELTSEWYIWSS